MKQKIRGDASRLIRFWESSLFRLIRKNVPRWVAVLKSRLGATHGRKQDGSNR
jgi:hypothetical protein